MERTKQAAGLVEGNCCPESRKDIKPISTKEVYHVAHYLGIGSKNRLTSEELCRILGCNKRSLQDHVTEDRKRRAWIVSFSDDLGGYALAESQEQYEAFCKWLIKKQTSSAAFFRNLIKDYDVERQEAFNEIV